MREAVDPPYPVGRAAEAGELVAVLEAADRSGSALLLRGETGVGKSTLLQWAAQRWRSRGARLLQVEGSEAEAVVPYAGLRRLLDPLAGHVDALPPRPAEVLHRVFGYGTAALHGTDPCVGPAPADAPEVFAVALAALDLLTLPGIGHPLLATVDDAHVLDDPTAQVLGFVARRLASDPVVVLIVTRSPGEPEALAGVKVLDVLPLAEADAGRVLDVHSPDLDPATREEVLGEAAGNPLALVSLPAVLAEDGPGPGGALPPAVRVEHALVRRVELLDPATLDALLVVATDDQADLGEVLAAAGHLAGRDLDESVLHPAVLRGLVTLGQDGVVRFVHPLLAPVLRDRAGAARRRDAHLALAAVAETPNRRLAHRAAVTTGVDDELADELAAAALRARRLGAPGSAVTPLTRSARLSSAPARRVARLVEAAQIAAAVGRPAVASRLLDEAEDLDPGRLDRIRIALVRARLHDDRRPDRPGAAALVALADEARSLGDGELAVALLALAAQHCWWNYPDAATRRALGAAVRRLPTDPLDARVLAMLVQAAPMEENPEVRRRLERRRGVVVTGADDGFLLGVAAYVVTDYAASARLLEQAATALRNQGRLAALAGVQTMLAYTEFEHGRWDAALEAAEEGLRLTRESRDDQWLGPALTVTSMLSALHGDEERADRLDAEADEVLAARGDTNIQGVLRSSRGRRAAHRGDTATTEALLLPLFDPAAPDFNPRSCIPAIFPLVGATGRGHRDGGSVLALIRSFVGDTARVDPGLPPGLVTAADHAEAVLGPDADADRRFDGALLRAADRPFDRARLEVAHADRLRRRRRTEQAGRVLRRAHATFAGLGNTPLATRTARSLSRLGDEGDRSRGEAWRNLTPQEGQISRLVAEGLSSREIGQRLFLSHRTVGSHLYRIFPKLGITSRIELARFVLGLDPGAW